MPGLSALALALALQLGCGQLPPDRDASQDWKQSKFDESSSWSELSNDEKMARKSELIAKMRDDLDTANEAAAVPPPDEVRKKLVGAWRLDAKLRDGAWQSWRQAGKSQDIEFREDGTVRAYLGTLQMDGAYERSPGDGCVDILMTLGDSNTYTYAYSIIFEDGKLVMSPWERTEFRKERMFKSVQHARQFGGLERFYRVKEFRGDE